MKKQSMLKITFSDEKMEELDNILSNGMGGVALWSTSIRYSNRTKIKRSIPREYKNNVSICRS